MEFFVLAWIISGIMCFILDNVSSGLIFIGLSIVISVGAIELKMKKIIDKE